MTKNKYTYKNAKEQFISFAELQMSPRNDENGYLIKTLRWMMLKISSGAV